MKCYYCNHYYYSDIRNNGQRFCKVKAQMIRSKDETCDKFDLTTTYRCWSESFDAGLEICVHRMNKGNEDCRKHCRQKSDILELRRWKGRQIMLQKQLESQQQEQSRPKILIRREPCEKTGTL